MAEFKIVQILLGHDLLLSTIGPVQFIFESFIIGIAAVCQAMVYSALFCWPQVVQHSPFLDLKIVLTDDPLAGSITRDFCPY
jgi:hypothetical protein